MENLQSSTSMNSTSLQPMPGTMETVPPTASVETTALSSVGHLEFAKRSLIPVGEMVLIVLWAWWVGRPLLVVDPSRYPVGGDYPVHASITYIWYWFAKCGACALWNGMANGGLPAFGEMLGGVLHPIVVLSVLLFGPEYGDRVAVVASLAMAGIGQWWLARVMGLGVVPRLWAGALVVVGGHFAATIEAGWPILVISIAAASLVLAPAVELALTGKRRSAVLLGVMLGLAIVPGHGYTQLALLFALLPPFLIFWFDNRFRLQPVWREYILAGGLALLVSAIYVLPLIHLMPDVSKASNPDFAGVQPLEYQPINLIIRDRAFIGMDVLGQKAIAGMHAYYIGWIPVLLALAAIRFAPSRRAKLLLYFVLAITLVYLTSAAVIPSIVANVWPGISGMRHPMIVATMAIPLVVALGAWGLDCLIKLPWPEIGLSLSSVGQIRVSIGWLLLAFPILVSLGDAYTFAQSRLSLLPAIPDIVQAIQTIKLDRTEWIRLPYGDMRWFLAGLQYDPSLKFILSPEHRGISLRDRTLPPAHLVMARTAQELSPAKQTAVVAGNFVGQDASAHYASVQTPSGVVPCIAHARGGDIDVDCETNAPGTLTVYENHLGGWNVTLDGEAAGLLPGPWLTVSAPAGAHHFEFRYRPWDVTVGLMLSVVGLVLAGVLWWRSKAPATTEQ